MVREALDNSELFARYHLLSRAVAELERVLEVYPDEIEIHKRLVGMCWKDLPERAERAAQALALIYAQQGDAEGARRFAQMAGEPEAAAELTVRLPAVTAPAKTPEPLPPTPAPLAPSPSDEADLTSELSPAPSLEGQDSSLDSYLPRASQASPTAFSEPPLDASSPVPNTFPPASYTEIQMVDLSQDLEGFLATKGAEAAASESAQQAAPFNFDDTKIEISFYLEQGFFEEARGAVESLEGTFRGDPRIAELRALVKAYTSGMPFDPPPKPPAVAQERAPVRVAPPGQQAVDRRESATGPEVPKPEGQPAIAPSIFPGEEEPPPGAGVETSTHLVGDFSEGIESGMGRPEANGISGKSKELAPQPAPAEAEGQRPRVASDGSSPKPGLEDDAEAHFNLGVAFWEMKHLDQAIREFQKVVNGAEKTSLPANYLQACSLLGACFMDKGMAPIAAKWYCRALETPHLDDEVRLALQYDLGVAYERAGDLPRALEMFSEVYGRRIDFRDVAEKVRAFQQKSS
jgi:tetratricopeptide (TPR) repeat protein